MELRQVGAGRPSEAVCLAADSVGKQGPGKGKMREHWSLALVQSRCGWDARLDLEPHMYSHFTQESQSGQREAWLDLRL